MTKAKSKTAGASAKTAKAASNKGGFKQSISLASKTAQHFAQQQKKPAFKKIMNQTERSVATTENISAPLIGSKDSQTTISTAGANTALVSSKLPMVAASSESSSSHLSVDSNQERDVNGTPRAGSKLAIVLGMLSEEGGASIDAIMKVTGWLSHTTRAVLTGLKKRGFVIDRQAGEKDSPSVYRIKADVSDGATMSSSPSASKRAA